MRILILCLALCGCANWMPMDCSKTRQISTITWDVVSDPYTTCKELGVDTLVKGGACISVADDKATIHALAPGQINDEFLGHEIKHAFGCKHI